MSNKAKELRGQVRQVVKEVLNDELISALKSQLRLDLLAELKVRLDAIDSRTRDLQAYLVRQSSPVVPNPLERASNENK